MTNPTPQPGLMDITPYKGGESEIEGQSHVRKLSANETPLGPSPKAIEAFRAMAGRIGQYPDGGATRLRRALGRRHGLDPDRIVCGNGSDELIGLLVSSYAGAGDEVLFSRHGFLMYAIAAKANGATPVMAPETDYTASVDALLAAVTERTRLVFLANPNNPTGTFVTADEVARLRAGLRDNVLLVIDAAYAEYVSRNDYEPGVELVNANDNVVMTRTFSKIYGLAGLRVGWAYAPAAVIDVLHRARGPFNVNLAAQEAALAALDDTAHIDAARTHNDVWLPKLTAALNGLGLETTASIGNFALARFPGGAEQALAADAFLKARGIIVRPVGAYGLPDCLRITIGTEDDNLAVIDALKAFLES
ncbi:MAG: histidinol-phosphate transaminase [Rhizobiales bacterium NRL2]|jgi:histidinol-phosphate aminotransferase|nr:MAG: histidinol-phosphate transaminase [Rhizobiales bacterium NRL2]